MLTVFCHMGKSDLIHVCVYVCCVCIHVCVMKSAEWSIGSQGSSKKWGAGQGRVVEVANICKVQSMQ